MPTESASAAIIANVSQVGSNVVVSYNGSLNIDGLTLISTTSVSAFVNPAVNLFAIGSGTLYDRYNGGWSSPTPSPIGTGGLISPNSSTGDYLGLFNLFRLAVPVGYTSGTIISGTSTYNNRTFADFGFTNGTSFVYTINSTPNDTLTLNIGTQSATTPEPSLILGTLLVGAFGFFGKKKSK